MVHGVKNNSSGAQNKASKKQIKMARIASNQSGTASQGNLID